VAVARAEVDSGSVVASGRGSLIETGRHTFEKEKPRQTRQTETTAAHRLQIFVVEGNRRRCDLAYVGGRL